MKDNLQSTDNDDDDPDNFELLTTKRCNNIEGNMKDICSIDYFKNKMQETNPLDI